MISLTKLLFKLNKLKNCHIFHDLNVKKQFASKQKENKKSFIADAQTSTSTYVSSFYPSVRSSASSLEEEVILSLLGLPSDMHKSSSGMNL